MVSIINTYGSMLLAALGQTCLLAFLSLIFACILGLVFGLMNVSHSKVLKIIGGIYVDAIRGVPLIVLAYFIYFGVPYAAKALGMTDFRLTALYAGTITLALNCGAYMAEILRAGIQSVDRGQMEAARSLGMSYGHSMRKVVLPQAIRTMIPSIINQFIITLKDTSILSVIGFPELVNTGKTVVANTMNAFGTWAIVGIMYMIVIISLSKIARQIERRVTNGR
ncbi:MAG: amino acid ABC transporter permease [Firmicutes bacterium]|uniref:Amino acid ABC transporter permease n=1 Tax=Candidatus Scybalomonas excrementavium TaxID=2840943 RepID=A0A9D9I2X7_9FIRM|nr:amino acid ABC transporter permease [Candidatus Scybalomonas excrementavium]